MSDSNSPASTSLQSQFSIVPPAGWAPLVRTSNGIAVRRMAEFTTTRNGKQNRLDAGGNIVSGAANTERQRLLSTVRFRPYKLDVSGIKIDGVTLRPDPDYDYYALDGYFEQSAFGSEFVSKDIGPKRSFQSLGYFADTMQLDLEFFGEGAEIFEFAPTSTVGTATESLTIGLTVSVGFGSNTTSGYGAGLGPTFSVAAQIAWTRSYSAPAVTVTPSRTKSRMSFLIGLPGKEYAFDGSSIPKPPSMSYFFEPQLIVRVKKDCGLYATVRSRVNWLYIWPISRIDDEIVIDETRGFGINAFYIEDVSTKQVLDVQNFGGQDTPVISFVRKDDPTSAGNQLWYRGPDGSLRTVLGGLSLATAENNANSNRLIVWEPLREAGQRWSFDRAANGSDYGTLTSGLGMQLASVPDQRRPRRGEWVPPSGFRKLVFRNPATPIEKDENRQWRLVFPEGGVL